MINARSPYFVVKQSTNLTQVDLDIEVRTTGPQHNTVASAQYSLTAEPVTTNAGGSQPFAIIDIAELIRDYIDDTFDGTYSSSPVWVCYQLTRYISGTPTTETIVQLKAFDGYQYFEEGSQSSVSGTEYTAPDVLQSNTIIYKPSNEVVRIPILQDNTPTVTFFYKGEVTNEVTISYTDDVGSIIRYLDNSGASFPVYSDRVSNDSGTLEVEALSSVFDRYDTKPCDRIMVKVGSTLSYYEVRDLEECKYDPIKVTFINKFGALQDIWFAKSNRVSMNTSRQDFKGNTQDRGTTGFTTDYDTSVHQKRTLYKNAEESIVLSSGFYPEAYNEVFRQLLLSEKVWIYYNNKTLPVNVSDTNISYKTSLNDKLIQYEINFDFAFDKISSIR